jgi:hypothetical protein
MRRLIMTVLTTAALVFFPNARADELLLNGFFESPAIATDSFEIANPDSWVGTGARIINGSYGFPGYPGPFAGQQYMSLGNDGTDQATLSQTFIVTTPGTYLLYWIDNFDSQSGGTSPYSVTVSNATTVVVNSNFVVSGQIGDTHQWAFQLMQFNLSAESYTLEFRSRQLPFGNPTMIGFVSLQGISSQASGLLFYGLNKGRLFVQASTSVPVPDSNNPFSVFAFAADRNPDGNGINSVTVDFEGGPLVLVPQATQRKISALIDREALVSFVTQTALDANFPNGDFTFNFDTVQDGVFSFTVALNGDSYPAAPHISNFAAAQAIDPAADFVLRWDSFAGGTTNDAIHVGIYDGTNLVFETSFLSDDLAGLNGRATSLLIPSYTLKGPTTYHGVITFVKGVTANRCTCGSGFTGYESTTKFDLQTIALRRSPSDIFPIAVTGISEIAYDLAFGGGNYLVAMLGRQNLTDNDDHGEVVGVLVGRDGTVLQKVGTGRFSGSAAVAYGTTNFLIVWDDEQNIFGQIIRADGQAIGGPFQISDDPFGTEQPAVAFNGTNFLVAWAASAGSGGDNDYTLLQGQLISPNGALIGGEIALASGAFSVVVAAGAGKFLVAAVDSDTESQVAGRFVDGTGALLGSRIDIDTTPLESGGPKTVFFDQTAQRFVVSFQDGSNQQNYDLFARTVDLNGVVGPRKTIASGSGTQVAAEIASDGHSLLITWNNGIFSPTVTSRARFFDSDLNPLGNEIITFVQHSDKVPFIAPVQFDGSRYLIVNSAVQIVTDDGDDHDFANGDMYGRFIVPSTPGIATQPRNQTVAAGANVTFSVEATGPQPITYQWQRNGVNVSVATSSSLTLTGVSSADAGAFRVLVSNSSGTTTSQAAQLVVLQPPTILVQPQSSLNVGFSQDITFSVVASGDGPLTYQWRLNGINIPGATDSSLIVQSAIETQGSYSVTVANPVGATNSAEASLTLQGPQLDFKDNFADRNIIANPAGGFGGGTNTGATKELGEPSHAGKTGGASVWYGWVAPDNGVVTFSTTGSGFDTLLAAYTGTSVNQLTPIVSDDDNGGNFASRVTFNVTSGTEYIIAVDGLGARTGRIFLMWDFQATPFTAPVIVASPPSRAVSAGSTVSLQATLLDPTAAQFQWLKDGVELAGATNNPLVINSFQQSDVGSYVVRVGNESGFIAFSEPAFVELGDAALTTDDKFEDARLNRIVVSGASAKASLTAPSAGTVVTHNYSSKKESGEPNHGGVIGGASRWFVIQPGISGALAIDTIGSDFDTVLAVYTGASLTALTLVAQDNDGAPDGIRSSVLFSAMAGVDYHVAVDGVDGAQGNITLNYLFGAPPQIVEGPVGKSVIAGSDFTLHVVAAAAPDLSYLWRLNGVPIPGATNAELVIAKCLPADQGTYTVEVSNPLGKVARVVNISVLGSDTPPSVVLTEPSPASLLVVPTNVHIAASASGSTPLKVEFFVNKKKIGESTAAPYGVDWIPPKAGKYTLTSKATDANAHTAVSVPVVINVLLPVTIVKQPLPRSADLGKTARFKVAAKGSAPLTYQWLFEGSPIPGAIKSSLAVVNVQNDLFGNYSVRVTNPAGSIESAPAALTLKP